MLPEQPDCAKARAADAAKKVCKRAMLGAPGGHVRARLELVRDLQSMLAVAAGTACNGTRMFVMTEVRFLLNGNPCGEVNAPPTMTVLDWLRTRAQLTGTKEGCAEGDCGACTIVLGRQVDGTVQYQAVNSCLMMLPQIDHCAVLTVEGLAAPDGTLHPVQQAMVDTDATQCGFCTPGFVMAMFAFQQGGEPADDTLIHEALAGNLCRCTGYRSIVEACRRVARIAGERSAAAGGANVEELAALAPCTDYRHGAQVYLAPRSLDALFAALAQSPDAILLGGGTDLGLKVSKDREPLPLVVATDGVAELKRITAGADALELGGAVTYSEALPQLDRHFPSFGALVRRIGSRQIRNLGTIAGNLATASPIGDTLPCLIALDATVTLASRAGERVLPVEDFITGYRQTALAAGEVIAAIRIPLLAPGQNFAVYKVSKRFGQDISTVIAAFLLERQGGKVSRLRAAFGGMAARAMRAAKLESAMSGRPWTPTWLADLDAVLARDFTPLSDHRGGAAYRLRAAAGLLRRFQHETTSTRPVRVEAI
jgi:xanthine dehydrogenase small subunit